MLLCDESKMLVKKNNFLQPDLVFESTFSGISFSLVDNIAKHEVAYMALNSSGFFGIKLMTSNLMLVDFQVLFGNNKSDIVGNR